MLHGAGQKKHFENKGDEFFDTASPALVPIDGSDVYYYSEDASNFYDVLGRNTEYTDDPEECMADNFSYTIVYGDDGPNGTGYESPEIIKQIREYLKKKAAVYIQFAQPYYSEFRCKERYQRWNRINVGSIYC